MTSSLLRRIALSAVILLGSALCACERPHSEIETGSSFASGGPLNGTEVLITYPMLNPDLSDGKADWNKLNCAQCHGENGAGVNTRAKVNLADDLHMSRRTPVSLYKSLVYELPKSGHQNVEKSLTTQQIWDLIFYVRSLSQPPLSEAQIKEMEPIFVGNCAVCHNKTGYGDGVNARGLEPQPANFHQFNRMFDRQDSMLYTHIRDGLYPSAMPPWANYKDTASHVDFDDAFLHKLVQYVRHFHITVGSDVDRFYKDRPRPLPASNVYGPPAPVPTVASPATSSSTSHAPAVH